MMKSSTKTAALSSYVNTAIRDYMKNHDESVDFPQEIWEVMTTDLDIFHRFCQKAIRLWLLILSALFE